MSRLVVSLLGPPRLERDGEPVIVDTRKAIALMAYLAVTRQRQSRDALATLLWPEGDQSHARAALRCTLSKLNKALAGKWLEIDRESLALDQRSVIQVDSEAFSRCLAQCLAHGHPASEVCTACVRPLSEAVTLYRDDFMAGFSLRDSPSFDDWQFFQADSLRRELASALERLVQCHTLQGNFEGAIACARRWLALDRLHEPAHRQLMHLYAWAGQRAAALHQYRECIQVLEEELGVAPLEPTTRLYQAIKENRVSPPPVAPQAEAGKLVADVAPEAILSPPAQSPTRSRPLTLPAASYPLVGRAAEWSTLRKLYAAAGRDGQVVILEGEAGIGKTRLAEEFLGYVQGQGARVVMARCYEGQTHLAFEPIFAGLHAAIARRGGSHWLDAMEAPWLSEAARLLPELALLRPGLPPASALDSPGAQSRFFEGLQQVLLALCRDGQEHEGVIFFDDVHWADGASLDLLLYLVRRIRQHPVCLIISWRSRQAASDARLHHLLTEAQRAGSTTVMALSRLSQAAVQELAQSMTTAGPDLSEGVLTRLHQETEGLPFFLVEYLTALAKGVLDTASDDWSLPGGARDLLHSRLAEVSETGWQLLTTAAVIGRSFDFDTLREVSGRSEEEAVNALEELIARGLVEEVQGSIGDQILTYDFSHEKLRTLVYEETSLARRRLLHRRIAEALMSHTRGQRESGILAGQIAYHYQMAGNEDAAAEYYTLAGEHARALYANAEALAHLRLALALGSPRTAMLHEAIGDVHTLLGEYSAALKSYETAAALSNPGGLANVEHKLGIVYERRGDWELAESHFDAALHVLSGQGAAGEQAKIYADWSLAAHHRGQIDRALTLAQQALALAEAAHDTQALAQTHNMLGILAGRRGNLEDARHHLEHSLALGERLHAPGIRAAALNNLSLVYRDSGEIARAIELAEAALLISAAQGDRHREAALHNNLADLLHTAGQSEAAMRHLKQAVSIYAAIGVEAGTIQPEIWKLAEW